MNLRNRIKTQPETGVEYIDLDKNELINYRGCGMMLARFIDGKLFEVFEPRASTAEAAVDELKSWLHHTINIGEVWLGMFSSCQFCDPVHVTMDNPLSMIAATSAVAEEYL